MRFTKHETRPKHETRETRNTRNTKHETIETHELGKLSDNVKSAALGEMTFSDSREKSSKDSFKGMASELLGIYPVMEQMASTVISPTGKLQNNLVSFFAMCDIVKVLQRVKRQVPVNPADVAELKLRQQCHLQAFMKCYGQDAVRPKHHYSLLIGDQCLEHKMLLDCFVLERKHRETKRAANQVLKSTIYEQSVMAIIWNNMLDGNREGALEDQLLGPQCAAPDLASDLSARQVLVGRCLQHNMIKIAVNDVLANKHSAIVVIACMLVDSRLQLLVKTYDLVRGSIGHASRWKSENRELAILDLSQAHAYEPASCWCFEPDGMMLIVY